MKYMKTVGVLLAALLSSAAIGGSTSAQELTFASPFSPVHSTNKFGIEPVLKQMNDAPNAPIKFKYQPGGQLFDTKSALSSLGNRIADGSAFIAAMFPRELKTSLVTTDLFLLESDPLVASAAAVETIMIDCADCQDEYKANGTIFLAGYSTSSYVLMCGNEVRTLADLKGRKIKFSSIWGNLVTAMGGVPVSMPMEDTIEAMQRGLLDCMLAPPEWLTGYPGTDEVVKYVIDYPFGLGNSVPIFAMNYDVWKSLNLDQKKFVLKHMPAISAGLMVDGYAEYAAAMQEAIKTRGIVVTKGGADFDEMIKAFNAGASDLAVDRGKRRGVKDPQKTIDQYTKNLVKWRKIIADGAGSSRQAYEKALNDEIYAKLDPEKM